MKLTITPKRKNEYVSTYRYRQIDEGCDKCVSTALICIRGSRFAGGFIPTMTVADVSTLPEYRNRGLVREMLETAHAKAREYGAYIALLHPFSFEFYKKFGYEKISDTVSVTFPLSALDKLSDAPTLIPLEEKYYDDVVSLFRKFSESRNLMLDRYNISAFLRKRAETYLYFRGTELCGYIIIEKNEEKKKITVSEMVFTDEEVLISLLSHLKNYKAYFDIAEISDAEPIPQVYPILDSFGGIYESRGDLAARILDTEGLLRSNEYPDKKGTFTLCVKNTLPAVTGIFKVTYENKKGAVERLPDDTVADVSADASALMRRIYGCDESLQGITVHGNASDFLRAFPKRINGLFEHF